jgi:hypothetical protein
VLIRTIETLRPYANFEATTIEDNSDESETIEAKNSKTEQSDKPNESQHSGIDGINLSYTINLNLPETSDIKVFDAIFKSLKENLLKK